MRAPIVTALLAAMISGYLGNGDVRAAAAESVIPDLFDPNYRPLKPESSAVKGIRFLTTDDFPPFHFALPDGTLTGLDIDLARAICADLKISCTIQARRFDTLIPQIKSGADDALIAAVANTAATRADLDFTAPYYTTPARFVVQMSGTPTSTTLTSGPLTSARPEDLAGRKIGVQANTAQEAYLRSFFNTAVLQTYPDQQTLRAALRSGEVATIFGDGITMALWLNGTDAQACCAFLGEPFTESRFFGNGVSVAVGRNNIALRQTLDYELAQMVRSGIFADLYLKYFPIGFY